jgi:hypothetical protein
MYGNPRQVRGHAQESGFFEKSDASPDASPMRHLRPKICDLDHTSMTFMSWYQLYTIYIGAKKMHCQKCRSVLRVEPACYCCPICGSVSARNSSARDLWSQYRCDAQCPTLLHDARDPDAYADDALVATSADDRHGAAWWIGHLQPVVGWHARHLSALSARGAARVAADLYQQ